MDGLIIVKPRLEAGDYRAVSALTALVLVDASAESETNGFDIVNVDDYSGVWTGMRFLYELGHKRVAFIEGLPESASGSERRRTHIDFIARYGLDTDIGLRKEGNFSWHSGFAQAYALLSLMCPPSAIFAANDLMALGAVKAAHERGFSIPRDVSLMGYDDIGMAELSHPALTTVRQPKYEIGTTGMKLILERMENKSDPPLRKIIFKTELMIRNSAGAAPYGKH